MRLLASLRVWALALALLAVAPSAALRAQDGGDDAQASAQTGSGVVEEPTEEQIRSAYTATLTDLNARSVEHLGADDAGVLTLELEDIVKLGCRGLDRPGVHFDCRVERRIRRGEERPQTDVVELWLSREDGRWVAR
ncbi:hypothetical protein CKO31_00180 [Thiohalocapsa halophila]|uniref:DUF3828 domain-containing protein n=1 Tax=Thiohalocapsa halophila TaxID=69359 RepID=A0ABS1CB92_9GAMM|nr:hypothetical protein [Thiohalocapsa halophila]MBK1629170.1 hypothetical protein [Thiohalocapsa halophila]